MRVTIAILFCDKDYFYIPSLLELIEDNVYINYEIILIDNREVSKSEELDLKNNLVIDMGYNSRQIIGRKEAIKHAKGEYIWFIDADDEPLWIKKELQEVLDKNYDAIFFNFYNESREFRIIENDSVINEPCSRSVYIQGRNMLWNKWIKTSILKKIEEHIPDNIVASASEDTALVIGTLKYSKSIYLSSNFIYLYRSKLGSFGIEDILHPENFIPFLIGHKEVTEVIQKMLTGEEIKKLQMEDIWVEDMTFFLKKLLTSCSNDIIEDVCKLIIEEFPRDVLLESWQESIAFIRIKKETFYKVREYFEKHIGQSLAVYKTTKLFFADRKGNEWQETREYEVLPVFED